jgi:hypothetical protein
MGWRSILYGRVHGRDLRRVEKAFGRPEEAQAAFLRSVLSRNSDTTLGRKLGFADCASPDDFRRRVPLSSYDDYREDIVRLTGGERRILTAENPRFFALTSGTTGPAKMIPVTPSLEKDMARAQVYWNARLVREDDAFGSWKYLVLVSSPGEREGSSAVPCRPVSSRILTGGAGHVFRLRPLYRAAMAAPGEVFEVRDGRARLHLTALLALSSRLGSVTAANPSTIVHFCGFLHENRDLLAGDIGRGEVSPEVRRAVSEGEWRSVAPYLARMRPDPVRAASVREILSANPFSLGDVWPSIKIVSCWLGGTLSLYLRRLRDYSRSIPLRDVGYRASEGFFAVPLANETSSGALHVTGNYFEFIEEGAGGRPPLRLGEVEPGGVYRLVVTQAGGLYRYDMEDVVEVTGLHQKTPLVRFLHKAGDVLSITGEKVSGLQAVRVVARLERELGLSRVDFILTHSLDIPPAYVFLFEADVNDSERLRMFGGLLRFLDSGLSVENVEYESKRATGRLAPASAALLAAGSLEALRSGFGGLPSHDAQCKPGHLRGEGRERDWILSRVVERLGGEGPSSPGEGGR